MNGAVGLKSEMLWQALQLYKLGQLNSSSRLKATLLVQVTIFNHWNSMSDQIQCQIHCQTQCQVKSSVADAVSDGIQWLNFNVLRPIQCQTRYLTRIIAVAISHLRSKGDRKKRIVRRLQEKDRRRSHNQHSESLPIVCQVSCGLPSRRHISSKVVCLHCSSIVPFEPSNRLNFNMQTISVYENPDLMFETKFSTFGLAFFVNRFRKSNLVNWFLLNFKPLWTSKRLCRSDDLTCIGNLRYWPTLRWSFSISKPGSGCQWQNEKLKSRLG